MKANSEKMTAWGSVELEDREGVSTKKITKTFACFEKKKFTNKKKKKTKTGGPIDY